MVISNGEAAVTSDLLYLEVGDKTLSARQVYDLAMKALHLHESKYCGGGSLNYELARRNSSGGIHGAVTAIDWVIDIKLAGNAALEDGKARLIFQEYECEWSCSGKKTQQFLTLIRLYHSLKIGTKQFYKTKRGIPFLVGSEIIRRGLWPIDRYLNKEGS